jgi:hypothetical protein
MRLAFVKITLTPKAHNITPIVDSFRAFFEKRIEMFEAFFANRLLMDLLKLTDQFRATPSDICFAGHNV